MIKIVHLVAHLGGGVGKALSGLGSYTEDSAERTIVCLEQPEKGKFVDRLRSVGANVVICPSMGDLLKLIEGADIVQLEWWNHPATIKCLYSLSGVSLRLLTWSHVSGLLNPIIPRGLIGASRKFVFTSACSYEAAQMRELDAELQERLHVISSCGGFEGFPQPPSAPREGFAVGYIGSLNFAKMHPRYVEFLATVDIPDFFVSVLGDTTNKAILSAQCANLGRPDLLKFLGFTSDAPAALRRFDVLAYLLNPTHYGTTENALLEAMAMGIVPVVLDNPAERQIIDDKRTGLIVRSPAEFAEAMDWLWRNPTERRRLGEEAARHVREEYAVEKTGSSFVSLYKTLIAEEKVVVDFREIFGEDPADWFLACQGDKNIFKENGRVDVNMDAPLYYSLIERSKGSVFHFQKYFPNNPRLAAWKNSMEFLQ